MCAKIKTPKPKKEKVKKVKREKVNVENKLDKKGLELKPFTISCDRHNALGIIKIAECPNFKILLCSHIGDEDPSSWVRMTVQNVDVTSYNNKHVRERVSEVVEFTPTMTFPAECWGTDVPDDVRKFLKDSISEFLVLMDKKINEWSISSGEDRYCFPVSKFEALQAKIVGVCMARKKKSRRAGVSKKERKIEEDDE